MGKSLLVVIAWFLFLTQVWAAVQKITFYEDPYQQGDSVTFTQKYANLSDCQKSFVNNSKSYCGTGVWSFWDRPNFEFNSYHFRLHDRAEICGNASFAVFQSGRFMGPADYDTPAIALYEGTDGYNYGGREYLVTGPAGNNIQFIPTSAYSWGNSSWTLFSGKNFDGNSTCFKPNRSGNIVYTGSTSFNSSLVAQSVAKGCDTVKVANNIKLFKNYFNLN